jgi:hypothetical protein
MSAPPGELPIDMSHPAIREYLALTRLVSHHLIQRSLTPANFRLQVLTPLSLLISLAVTTICATMIDPTLGSVSSNLYPTTLTPKTGMVATFVGFLYLMQIGYCVLLVVARKEETKV